MLTEIKRKNCRSCGGEFMPFRTTDSVCSMRCASDLKYKKEASKGKKKKENRLQLIETAVAVFHAFIRERDKGKPCICCGKKTDGQLQAGHYFSGGGHAAVKFDEMNVHGQRGDCNTTHRSGMLNDYVLRLIKRIGEDEFEVLRANAYEEKYWSVEDLRKIITTYRKKLRTLQELKTA